MTYAELKAQFEAILNRTDITSALTILFLNQAQTRAQRVLRIPAQEKQVSLTVPADFESMDVPTDFQKTIAMSVDGNNSIVTYLPLERFMELKDTSVGIPMYFTRQGDVFKFKPTPAEDTVLVHDYYGDFPAFGADGDSTTITTIAPDLILYGALSYASDYYLDERGPNFEARFQEISQNLQDMAYDYEGPSIVHPAYSFPED